VARYREIGVTFPQTPQLGIAAVKPLFEVSVVAIDCGANIGIHTIEWATAMTGWGSVKLHPN
jgi:hypothetical protein